MRFCEMFISYKIGLKSIKNTIPFTKLPLYRKIAAITTFALSTIALLLLIFKLYIPTFITLGICFTLLIIFLFIDSRKNNLELMLKEHYTPYSQNRMNMVIDIFHEYDLDVHNMNTIDQLIEEAQIAQIQNNYLLPLKKPLKALAAVVIPIITYVAQKIGDTASQYEILTTAAQIIMISTLIISFLYSLAPVIKDIIYPDNNRYNDLIYDLRQLKLFYAKEDFSSLKQNK